MEKSNVIESTGRNILSITEDDEEIFDIIKEDMNSLLTPTTGNGNIITSWLSIPKKLWQSFSGLVGSNSNNSSLNNEHYTFQSYLKDCKQAMLSPSTHEYFLKQLKCWEEQEKIDFQRNFKQDFVNGFNLSLFSMMDADQVSFYLHAQAKKQPVSHNTNSTNELQELLFGHIHLVGGSNSSLNYDFMLDS